MSLDIDLDLEVVEKVLMDTSLTSKQVEDVMLRLKHIQKVTECVEAYTRKEEEEQKRHTLALQELSKFLKSVRDECQHPYKTYCSDASGGNDSFYRCNICGKEF